MSRTSTVSNAERAWFALRVRSNFERTVSQVLRAKGVEEFLPLYRSRRIWADRIRDLDTPLFPGYVFCRVVPQQHSAALATTGVVAMVGVQKSPLPIPDEEIAAVKRMAESGNMLEIWPLIRIGQRVRVRRGPLAGLDGTLLKIHDLSRLAVSVTLLGRSVLAQIDAACVTPV